MKRPLSQTLLVVAILCSLPSNSMSQDLNEDYDRSELDTIGVFSIPSNNAALDEMFVNMLQFDLLARGYSAFNAREALGEDVQKLPAPKLRKSFAKELSTRLAQQHRHFDALLIVGATWDSLDGTPREDLTKHRYRLFRVLKTELELTLFDFKSSEEIYSGDTKLTQMVFPEKSTKDLYYEEPAQLLCQRLLTELFSAFPSVVKERSVKIRYQFPVVFYADQHIVELLGETWKQRIAERLIYVNDVLLKYFETQLSIKDFRVWNCPEPIHLESAVANFRRQASNVTDAFAIGVTFDSTLRYNYWNRADAIGYAYILGNHAVIKETPVFPNIGIWGQLNQALTLIHEIAHMFGALHCRNKESIMYPLKETMSPFFDDATLKTISQTRRGFFSVNEEERFAAYEPVVTMLYTEEGNKPHLYIKELASLSSAEKSITDSSVLHTLRGYKLFEKGKREKAEAEFIKALKFDPNFFEAQQHLELVRKGRSSSSLKED